MARKLTGSAELLERAQRVVPGGIYGHMAPGFLVPGEYPSFIARGEGASIWDVDGNRYIDYMCSYGPIVLGHRHPVVEAAVESQRANAFCFSLPGPAYVDLAELLVEKTPFANWAMFAKNGSDATTWATAIARAHTGRKKILRANGAYHGVAFWCNPAQAGITDEDTANVVSFEYNDLESLTGAVSKHADELAGIIVTPYRHEAFHDQELPVPEFHSTIRNLCDDHGIVYILDDVRCGFRLDLAGSGHYYGTEPDLSCYCKALGNGYPISALMGREALRGAAQQVFMTGSYWMSSLELAAAVATVNELERIDGCRRMREYGIRLRTGLARQAAEHGLEVRLTGEPGLPFMTFADDSVFERAKLWCAECIRRGVFFHPSHNWFLTTAHGDAELEATLEATEAAFEAVAQKFRA